MPPFEALQGVFQEMVAQLGPPVSDVLWFWIGVFFFRRRTLGTNPCGVRGHIYHVQWIVAQMGCVAALLWNMDGSSTLTDSLTQAMVPIVTSMVVLKQWA